MTTTLSHKRDEMTTIRAATDEAMSLQELVDVGGARLADDPKWLEPIRTSARRTFLDLGLPTLKDEEWRLTSLKTLSAMRFAPAPDVAAAISEPTLKQFSFSGLEPARLVFVNGRFAPGTSRIDGLPEGVTVRTLREAGASTVAGAIAEANLARHAAFDTDAFAALNTAMAHDVAIIHIRRDVQCERPIRVVNVAASLDAPAIFNPRVLIVAEEGAKATVIEDYVALTDAAYFTNSLTEIVVGANADVRHYFIERESPAAVNVSTLKIRQERDSRFVSHSVLLGGVLVRNNVNPVLAGENCHSVLNGLYVGLDRQHLDNHMRVEHAAAHCDSRQYYRGILADRSVGVFSGRIIVAEGSQKTDAVQRNQNLLLSNSARAHTKPQLEIYADDVKCTHGATIGELDEQAMFYLRTRGVPAEQAKGLLIYAFARESLDRMELQPVRDTLRELVLARIPHTAKLGDLL